MLRAVQVSHGGATSKRMTRLGYFKRVDSEGNSVEEGESEGSEAGEGAGGQGDASDGGAGKLVNFLDLTQKGGPFQRLQQAARSLHDSTSGRRTNTRDNGSDADDSDGQGSCNSSDLGPELDPVARVRAHGEKSKMKIEKGGSRKVEDTRDRLAPQPQTAALMRRVPGELLDPGADSHRPRGVPGVGAVTAGCDEEDAGDDDCGATSDPETSDAPELHMHEGAAAAAPVRRVLGASGGANPLSMQQRAGAQAEGSAPVSAMEGGGGGGGVGGAADVARGGNKGAAKPPAPVGRHMWLKGSAAGPGLSDVETASQDAAAAVGPVRGVGVGLAVRLSSLPAPVAEATTAQTAPDKPAPAPAPAAGAASELPAQWRAGSGESVRISGALRAVMGARRWRARAIATVPEAAVLEGEANASCGVAVDSSASDGGQTEREADPTARRCGPPPAAVCTCIILQARRFCGHLESLTDPALCDCSVDPMVVVTPRRTAALRHRSWPRNKMDKQGGMFASHPLAVSAIREAQRPQRRSVAHSHACCMAGCMRVVASSPCGWLRYWPLDYVVASGDRSGWSATQRRPPSYAPLPTSTSGLPSQRGDGACCACRGCSVLRATLLGVDPRKQSSQLLSMSSDASRTSSDGGDRWSSSKDKDL